MAMSKAKRKRLEDAGWPVGGVELLGLSASRVLAIEAMVDISKAFHALSLNNRRELLRHMLAPAEIRWVKKNL